MIHTIEARAASAILALALATASAAAATASCTTADDASSPPRGAPSSSSGGTSGGASSGGTSSGGTSGAPGAADAGSSGTTGGDGGGGGGAGSPSTGGTKTACKYTAHKTGLTALEQAGGLSFHVYAPASYDPNVGHTMVVIMHGQDSDGVPELTALWQPLADEKGLVLLAPRGSRPSTTGNPDVGNWATADLDKVLALMTEIDDCYDVFTKKHILWGFSEGGFYGYLLGIGAAERFSGLAMGGSNTSFARENGFEPASASWKIPVSDVHGTQDFNPIALTYQDRDDFQAAGHVFTLHQHDGGHTISPDQVRLQFTDLADSISP